MNAVVLVAVYCAVSDEGTIKREDVMMCVDVCALKIKYSLHLQLFA